MGRTKHRKKHAQKIKRRKEQQLTEKRNISNKLMGFIKKMQQLEQKQQED